MLFEDKDVILYKKITSDKIAEFNMTVKSIAEKLEYYVYKHYLDGELFYIGKGTGPRCLDFKGRSEAWENYVDGRYDRILVFIERAFSCENEAFNYESKAIMTSESKNLVNVTHNNPYVKEKVKNNKSIEVAKFKKPTNVFLSNEVINNLPLIKDIKMLEFNILVALISEIKNKRSVLTSSLEYNEVRLLIGSTNLQAHKIKNIVRVLQDKYNILTFKELSKTKFKVEFSEEFTELFLSSKLGYSMFNFNEFISMKSIYSKVLYLKLSQYRMLGVMKLKKSEFLDLFEIPISYDDYNFKAKVLLPAIEDNSNFFVNLKLSNLRGNELPEVCKFSFFKKRSTKMERELALATRENIFELIEEYGWK